MHQGQRLQRRTHQLHLALRRLIQRGDPDPDIRPADRQPPGDETQKRLAHRDMADPKLLRDMVLAQLGVRREIPAHDPNHKLVSNRVRRQTLSFDGHVGLGD
ncbi:hypothetical protein D3C87_1773410 [compost metagenome]